MWSCLVSTLSPKKLLAASISKSLAAFFHVDPEKVETHLVQDSKVTLKDIEIKQRRLGGLVVYGTVGHIEFSWAWDAGSFITDAKLTVKGVDIHVRLVHHDDEQEASSTTAPLQLSNQAVLNVENGKDSDWRSRYKQQIIDHLTLSITDLSVAIQLLDESLVVFEAQDLEVQTLQHVGDEKDGTSALLQEICLGSIVAWIQDPGDTRYPILDPFGYRASVQRITGRRFLDGILSGLMIQGNAATTIDEIHVPSTIRMYAGKQQLAGLNCLQLVLQSVGNGNNLEMIGSEKDSLIEIHEQSLLGVASSVVRLPFQSIEVVLEDDVKLRLEGCEVKCRMDCSELALRCVGGIWMGNFPILKNGAFIVDFVDSKVELMTVCSSQQENEVFYNAQSSISDEPCKAEATSIPQQNANTAVEICFSIDLFEQLRCSIHTVLPEWQQAAALTEQRRELHSGVQPHLPAATSASWIIVSKQPTSFRFEGHDSEWIRVTMSRLNMEHNEDRNGLPFIFSGVAAQLDCSSGLALNVPTFETKNKTIAFSERVSASMESVDTIRKLKAAWADVFSIFGSQSSSHSEMMFSFATSGIDVAFADPSSGTITLDKLNGTGSAWNIDTLRMGGVMGLSTEARNLQLSIANGSQRLQIKEILSCAYDGSTLISSPIQELELKYQQGSISISCDYLAMLCQSQGSKTMMTSKAALKDLNQLEKYATTLNLRTKKLHVSTDTGYELTAERFKTSLALGAQSNVQVSVGFMNVQHSEGQEFECRGIKGKGSIKVPKQLSDVPVWKMFSFAMFEVANIGALVIPSFGHLHAPIDTVNISLDNNIAMVRCNTIKFCCPKMEHEDREAIQSSPVILNWPSLRCHVHRLVLMPRFGTGKPGVCFDEFGVSCAVQDKSFQLKGHCNYVQGRGPKAIKFAMKQMQFSAIKSMEPTSNVTMDLFGFQEAEVSVKEISSFAAAGNLRLTKPITGFNAQYGNGEIVSTLGELNVLYEHAGNGQVKDQVVAGASGLTASLPIFRVVVRRGIVEWASVEGLESSRGRFSFENSQLRLVQDSSLDCIRFDVDIDSMSGRAEDGSVAIASRSRFEGLFERFANEGAMLESFSIPQVGYLHSARILLSEIEAFHVPNFFRLESPSRSVEAKLSNNELVVSLNDVVLHRFGHEHVDQQDSQSPSFDLPFKIKLSIVSLSVEDILQPNTLRRKVRCTKLGLGFEPTLAKIGTERESPGAGVFFRCHSLEIEDSSSVFVVPEISGSGLLQYSIPDTIGNLVLGLEKAQLQADFSSMEWSGSGTKQHISPKLPFAALPKFVLTLKCSATLLRVEDATIACDAFEGNSETTLEILQTHYMGIVQERIPYILAAKTSIAGANIGDSIGMMAGTIVTNTSVVGAAVGVASRDAVGSAVQYGKVARGADESEKYKFGDFTRGVIASVKGAAKSGAEMRNDEQYQFGDFTAGTTKAASSYASKNRMRLAGAGGSAAGMIAGAAILGPVGFVAGSLLGSSAAQSSVRSITGDHGENEDKIGGENVACGSDTHHQSLDRRASSFSHPRSSSNGEIAPLALNAEARMVGGVSTSEQRVVIAQAQVVDLLSSEQPVPSIAPPPTVGTRRSTQSTLPRAPVTQAINESPFQAQINVVGASNPLFVDAAYTQQMSEYPIAPATSLLAPSSSSAHPQATVASVGAYPNDVRPAQQQRNMPAPVQPRSIQGVVVARQHAPSATSNNTTGSQQQEGYRFGDVTRGIIARGRELDGRNENSGYKFGDFTRGLFR